MAGMNKDVIPQDFTLSLVLVDAMPVLFFLATSLLLGIKLQSIGFIIGAILCMWAGVTKVIWKLIVVLKKKNIWFLFVQMRKVMPIGLLIMIIFGIMNHSKFHLFSFPSIIFFGIGVLGMIGMIVFSKILDSSDVKANWIEQITNALAQAAFFIGFLLM